MGIRVIQFLSIKKYDEINLNFTEKKSKIKSGKTKTVLKSTQMNGQKILRGLVNNLEGIRQNDFVTQGEKGAKKLAET